MSIYWTIILGFVIGVHAELLLPEREPVEVAGTALSGIGGALVAGFVAGVFGWYATPGDARGLVVSILGAVAAVAIYGWVVTQRAVRP